MDPIENVPMGLKGDVSKANAPPASFSEGLQETRRERTEKTTVQNADG